MAQVPIKLTSLDINELKASLKTFLKDQATLQDYNYEGSVLSVLLRLLAYNTQNQSFYLNMIGNEMFLDSATRRESIVSHAKLIGYTPRSKRSAVANLYMKVTPDATTQVAVPVGTRFETELDGVTYTFRTVTDYTITENSVGDFEILMDVVEGVQLTHVFDLPTEDDFKKIIIPNRGVDTSKIRVTVKPSPASSLESSYNLATDILSTGSESPVYFIEEVIGGLYRLYFGDGTIGKKPTIGSRVIVTYLVSAGDVPNGAAIFDLVDPIPDTTSVDELRTIVAAAGGVEQEDQESVRLNAPLFYETQNRAVTANDYARIVRRDYPFVEAVSVWGGENSDPPQYGFVFISIKPIDGIFLSDVEKSQIEIDLKQKYAVVSISPVVVDPIIMNIKPSIKVFFDPSKTSLSVGSMVSLVRNGVGTFAQKELNKFDRIFKGSRFGAFIDNLERSIAFNQFSLTLGLSVPLDSNRIVQYSGSFRNEIVPGTLVSSPITVNLNSSVFFEDDGKGVLNLARIDGSTKISIANNVGTINYKTGDFIILPALLSSVDNVVVVEAECAEDEVFPIRNQILSMSKEDAEIEVVDAGAANVLPAI